ncbi:hypothetical protein E5288_WYG016654 [Bos mutus]|uniref:Uncharacterized protein n=1 Tax=Bos mutus TaxID=72004 RepID=A0A6B0R3D9_9CETA|nr:hypothetical protein [Bos mutus]
MSSADTALEDLTAAAVSQMRVWKEGGAVTEAQCEHLLFSPLTKTVTGITDFLTHPAQLFTGFPQKQCSKKVKHKFISDEAAQDIQEPCGSNHGDCDNSYFIFLRSSRHHFCESGQLHRTISLEINKMSS